MQYSSLRCGAACWRFSVACCKDAAVLHAMGGKSGVGRRALDKLGPEGSILSM